MLVNVEYGATLCQQTGNGDLVISIKGTLTIERDSYFQLKELTGLKALYLQLRESQPPLSIPTPTPGPATALGDTSDRSGCWLVGWLVSKIRA